MLQAEPLKIDALTMLVSTARIDEPQAMAAFLASIPDSEELAELLGRKEPLNTRAYEDEEQTARFVISDGTTVTCFTITDITIDQAEMITLECEKSDAWSDSAFREAATRALAAVPLNGTAT
jgi:GH24 family phage-related lysozyme (muramidase)